MQIFDGRYEAKKLDEIIKNAHKPATKLAIILIGNDPSSQKFVEIKRKYCEEMGIPHDIILISETETDSDTFSKVKSVMEDPEISGSIIQLPLPRESLQPILELIPQNKDVDLINPVNLQKYYAGDFSKLSPIVRAFDYFLKQTKIDVKDKNVGIIGSGYLVGKPIAYFIKAKKPFVLDQISRYEDKKGLDYHLVCLCAGVPNLVNGSKISANCNVVDFGSSVINGKCVGDLDLTSKTSHLNYLSPSPGGMGPLVVRMLILNFLGL